MESEVNLYRSYKVYKQTFGTENYISSDVPKLHRSDLAKFRCGVAPIRLETGRYEILPLDECKCFVCN